MGRNWISTWILAMLVTMSLTLGPGLAWGEEPPAGEKTEEEVKKPEVPLPGLPKKPSEQPGFFPTAGPATPYGSADLSTGVLGPATGLLAPYGNAAAYDTLSRGWIPHKVGPVTIYPFLEYDAMYRSNVFLTPTNPKGDFINCINPGLRLDAQITPKNRISVGWLGNAQIYSKYTDQSYFTQNFNIDLDLNLDFTRTGRLSFKVGNAIRSGLIEQSPENGRTRPYLRDTPYIQAGYVVSEKMKIVGFYQYDGFSFTKSVDKFNNYQQNSGGVTVFYKFWPKTAALLQYMIVSTTYPDSPVDNSNVHTVLTGLSWDPTAKLNGTIKFGVSITDYDQSAPDRNKTPTSFVTSVSTAYRYSKFTTFNLTVQRSKQDNINYDNAPYWNTGVFFTVTRDWHYLKSTLYAGISYTNNDYINPTLDGTVLKRRQDNVFYIVGGLYSPLNRWLRLRFDYSYIDNQSNFSSYTYSEHRVLLGLQAAI